MATRALHRQTQCERILAATIELVAREGYPAVTISQIVKQAGVSRPTFYEYYADRQACFFAAIETVNAQLLTHVDTAIESAAPERAAHAAIETLVAFCRSRSAIAAVLLNASLAGTPQAQDARADGIAALANAIDGAHRGVPSHTPLPDIDSSVLIGGIYRLLASRLRREHAPDEAMLADLLSWVDSYAVPAGARRWSTLRAAPSLAASRFPAEPPFGVAPLATPPRSARPRLEHHRQRLLFAAAELAIEKGLSATTITEIARHAGVGYRRVSSLFATKQDLFLALHELAYKRTLAATVGAYFSPAPWPERLWAAAEASTQFVAQNPAIARICFLEPYAAGPRAAQNMDNALGIFTALLAEADSNLEAGREHPPRLAFDAITATSFELGYRMCRAGKSTHLPSLQPQGVFLALAPFLGPQAAVDFIDSKLRSRPA